MTIVVILALTLPALATARTWHVPADAPTIQAGIDSAGVDDDVLVAPGTYFEHDIVMKAGIMVKSEQGHEVTTVDATSDGVGFDCADIQQTSEIEGFTIVDGFAYGTGQDENSGGGVRCVGSSIVVRNCVITRCEAGGNGGGIYAWESEVEIEACEVADCSALQGGGIYALFQPPVRIADCEIVGNGASVGGGIVAMGSEVAIVRCVVSGNRASWGAGGGIVCASPALVVIDCLITENVASVVGEGSGLLATNSSGVVDGCTITRNIGSPSQGAAYLHQSEIEFSRTIVAFNEDRALGCPVSQVTVNCCDIYGNTTGNDLCGTDLGGNFSEDPLFCDAENGNYTLDGCSPCMPGNHPEGVDCGLIGALGQGCGATAVEETSWGRIKSLYRR